MHVLYKFQIPDKGRPIPVEEQGNFGPSGHLVPFRPRKLNPADVLGRRIEEVSTCVGTYGMGGPGFFGLRLGREWLVISIWGAAEWIHVNGRLVEDVFAPMRGRPAPWIRGRKDALSARLVGSTILYVRVGKHSLSMRISGNLHLRIEKQGKNRPIAEGSKRPRTFCLRDDLRRGIFLSPTAEIWV